MARCRRIKDPFSGFSHAVGAGLSVAGLVTMVVLAVRYGTARHVVSAAIFGAALILLFTASAVYHLVPAGKKGERILRSLDHTMIFMLIAGTYTPFCLVTLKGPWGWSIFGVVWGLALIGVFLSIFWLHAPRWLSTGIYVLMGWVVIVAVVPLVRSLPAVGLAWLVAGGLAYTIGAVIYGTKKPDPWPGVFGFHEIWHLFVLAGAFCHYMAVVSGVLLAG